MDWRNIARDNDKLGVYFMHFPYLLLEIATTAGENGQTGLTFYNYLIVHANAASTQQQKGKPAVVELKIDNMEVLVHPNLDLLTCGTLCFERRTKDEPSP